MEGRKLRYDVRELSFSNAILVESGDSEKDFKDDGILIQKLKDQVKEYFNSVVDNINF